MAKLKTQIKAEAKLQEKLESKEELNDNQLYKYLPNYASVNKTYPYGYVKEEDFVCISKTGKVGTWIEIQGLIIGIPKAENVYNRSDDEQEQLWEAFEMPDILKKIPSTQFFEENVSGELYDELYDLQDQEWERRKDGFWFKIKGVDTWITGTHYMYLQHSYIDVGLPDYRDANRIFFYFWEACKADARSYGMCYLKNRRSGFSFMASAETVNIATQTKNAKFGILSKTGADAKGMFVNKVVPISVKYPFFFKPIQSGMDKPKTEIVYDVPGTQMTKSRLKNSELDEWAGKGLGSSIDHRATGDNSYDGEKLRILVHDESGKWLTPNNIEKNWRVTKTCLRLGSRIVGKCMMGSTSNALDSGGEEFKKLYHNSDVTKRNRNGQTVSGLYSLFVPMEWGFEGYIDKFGYPVFRTPEEPVMGIDGLEIYDGVIDNWENEVDGLKSTPDDLNEFYRQYPRSESHAFRDVAMNSIFNLTKIYEQIDSNIDLDRDGVVFRGNFGWENGIKDSKVEFYPNNQGKFYISWIPPAHLQNNRTGVEGSWGPGNIDLGAFGCDSYDISGAVGGGGSNGALHGLTTFNMADCPTNEFFLEYVARPKTVEEFYEQVLMACVFYGMPALIENNKPGILYHFRRRGYRKFCMNRPDKRFNDLSVAELEIGGIPNTSEAIKQAHASAIGSYIENHVGGEDGRMFFNRTLNDWSRFDINKRTKHDASISSGLAIMATQKHLYAPSKPKVKKEVTMPFGKFSNDGMHSQRITRKI